MTTNKGSVTLAFLVGGIVGAGFALLYAPSSGVETRKRLRQGVDDAGNWVTDRYMDAKDKVSEGTDRVKEFVNTKKEDFLEACDVGRAAYHKGKQTLMGH